MQRGSFTPHARTGPGVNTFGDGDGVARALLQDTHFEPALQPIDDLLQTEEGGEEVVELNKSTFVVQVAPAIDADAVQFSTCGGKDGRTVAPPPCVMDKLAGAQVREVRVLHERTEVDPEADSGIILALMELFRHREQRGYSGWSMLDLMGSRFQARSSNEFVEIRNQRLILRNGSVMLNDGTTILSNSSHSEETRLLVADNISFGRTRQTLRADVTARDVLHARGSGTCIWGVQATIWAGTHADGRGPLLERNAAVLRLTDGAQAWMECSNLTHASASGVVVMEQANLTAVDTSFEHNGAHGVWVLHAGSRATLFDCRHSAGSEAAIAATGSGYVVARSCNITGDVRVEGRAVLDMRECLVADGGLSVRQQASLLMADSEVRDATKNGVLAEDKAQVDIVGSRVAHSNRAGLLCENAMVKMTDCYLEKNLLTGVKSVESWLTLVQSVVRMNGEDGVAILGPSTQSNATISNTIVTMNSASGIRAEPGAIVSIFNSTISENGHFGVENSSESRILMGSTNTVKGNGEGPMVFGLPQGAGPSVESEFGPEDGGGGGGGGSPSLVVPLTVSIVLVVLISLSCAYLVVGRSRRARGYDPAGAAAGTGGKMKEMNVAGSDSDVEQGLVAGQHRQRDSDDGRTAGSRQLTKHGNGSSEYSTVFRISSATELLHLHPGTEHKPLLLQQQQLRLVQAVSPAKRRNLRHAHSFCGDSARRLARNGPDSIRIFDDAGDGGRQSSSMRGLMQRNTSAGPLCDLDRFLDAPTASRMVTEDAHAHVLVLLYQLRLQLDTMEAAARQYPLLHRSWRGILPGMIADGDRMWTCPDTLQCRTSLVHSGLSPTLLTQLQAARQAASKSKGGQLSAVDPYNLGEEEEEEEEIERSRRRSKLLGAGSRGSSRSPQQAEEEEEAAWDPLGKMAKKLRVITRVLQPVADVDLAVDPKHDIRYVRKLGRGGFATVYEGWWMMRDGSEKHIAIKVMDMRELLRKSERYQMLKAVHSEMNIMTRIDHGNVVRCYGGCVRSDIACLLLEYMDGGALDGYVHLTRRLNPLTVREVLAVGQHLASALAFLHPMIIHADLKPENALLSSEGVVKLTDFGLSKIKVATMMSSRLGGTPAYTAPEVFWQSTQSVTEKVDIYALGVLLWECLTCVRPTGQFYDPTRGGPETVNKRPQLPSSCPPDLVSIVQRCWSTNTSERPTASELQVMLAAVEDDLDESPAQ